MFQEKNLSFSKKKIFSFKLKKVPERWFKESFANVNFSYIFGSK